MKKESCRAITNSAAFLLKIFLASAGRVAVTEGGDLGGLGVIPQQAFWPDCSGQNRKTCICLHCLPFLSRIRGNTGYTESQIIPNTSKKASNSGIS